MFGCGDAPLDELAATLTESAFFATCVLLERIRKEPKEQRPTLALALDLFIDLDLPTPEQKQRALNAAQAIVRGLSS